MMNELAACSNYDDGICKPTGDVCLLPIENHHRCVLKQPTEIALPDEEWFKDKIIANYPCLDPGEDDLEWAENLGQWLRDSLIKYLQEKPTKTIEEPAGPSECPHRGSKHRDLDQWWCIVWQMWCGAGGISECGIIKRTTEVGYLSPEQVDAVKAEAVKKAIEEYQVEIFPGLVGLIPESECQVRIDDAVKAVKAENKNWTPPDDVF